MYADWLTEDLFRLRAWKKYVDDNGDEQDDGEEDDGGDSGDSGDSGDDSGDGGDDSGDGGGDGSGDDGGDDSGDDSGDGGDGGDYFDWGGGGDSGDSGDSGLFDWHDDTLTSDTDRGFTRDSSPYVDDGYEQRMRDRLDEARKSDRPRSYYDRHYDAQAKEVFDQGANDVNANEGSDQLSSYYRRNPDTQKVERTEVPWYQREATDTPPPMPPTRQPDRTDTTSRQAPTAPQSQAQAPIQSSSPGPVGSALDAAAKNIFQEELGRERNLMLSGKATPDDVPLLKEILADWRRESGRAMPNEGDQRDMQNFWKYSEDWAGVASDRSDRAEKLGVRPFRNAVFAAASNQLENERRGAQQVAQRGQPRNPQGPLPSMVPGGINQNTGRDIRGDYAPAPAVPGSPQGRDIRGDYAPAPRVEQSAGAAEVSDAEAQPYIDEDGQRRPSMVSQQNMAGMAQSERPQVAGAFTSMPSDSRPETPVKRELLPYDGTPVKRELLPYDGAAPVKREMLLSDGLTPETARIQTQHGPFLSELAPTPTAQYAPLISQVAAEAQDHPLDAAAKVLLAMQGGSPVAAQDTGNASTHIGAAISALVRDPKAPDAQWAIPAVDAIARMAFAQEYGASPTQMPSDYAANWIESWKHGEAPPLAEQLDKQLREVGAWTPGTPLQQGWKQILGRDLATVDQGLLISDPKYRQMMDRPISLAEAKSICGPIAAMALARVEGKDISLGEAIQMGAAVGWDTGGGMNGLNNERRLAENMGIAVEVGGFDSFRASRDVSEDRPVIISTSGHYFLATDYDAQSGKFYVGATGRAYIGGSEWMTPKQMESLTGAFNGALYYKGKGQVAAPASSPAPAQATSQPASQAVYGYNGPIDYRRDDARNGTAPGEIEDYIQRAAAERGMDVDDALKVARWEGSLNHKEVINPVLQAANGQPSWGPFQLHVEGAHLGDAYIKATGLHPKEPRGWKMAIDYALDTAIKDGNWNQWYAADRVLPNGRRTRVKGKPRGFSDEAKRYAGLS